MNEKAEKWRVIKLYMVENSVGDSRFFATRGGRFVQWGILILAVGLAIRMVLVDNSDLGRFLGFEIAEVAFILSLYFVMFLSSAAPFVYIIKILYKKNLPFYSWLRIIAVSKISNMIIPQTGMIYKAVTLKGESGLSYTEYVESFALFVWTTTLLDLLLATISIFVFSAGLEISGMRAGTLTGAAFGICILSPIGIFKILQKVNVRVGYLSQIQKKIQTSFEAINQHWRNMKFLGSVALFGLVAFWFSILILKSIFDGIGIEVGYAHLAVLVAIKKISGLLVVTPGNIGVREVIFGLVCESLGIGSADGIMASVLLRVAGYLVFLMIGIALSALKAFLYRSNIAAK